MTKADYELDRKLTARGIDIPLEDVRTLRRAELTLHRWYELECGDGNGYIERKGEDEVPYYYNCRARYLDPKDPRHWRRYPDRENGAKRRVEAVCKQYGLNWYYQTDPRGCALYVSREPLQDSSYSSVGIAIC